MRKAPMWQFHKELCPEGKIFHDEAELQALDSNWVDSPTMFDAEKVEPKSAEVVEKPKAKKKAK